MKTSSPGLRQRQHAATVEALLDSAEQALIRHGYDKATMQQIAAAAGCAAGTFYLYFKNKQDLLEAIMARHVARMAEQARAQMAGSNNPLERARLLLSAMFGYGQAHRPLFQLVFNALPMRHRAMHTHLGKSARTQIEDIEQDMHEQLLAAQEQSLIRTDIPVEALHHFISAVSHSFMEEFCFAPSRAGAEQQMRTLWGLITGGLAARSDGE